MSDVRLDIDNMPERFRQMGGVPDMWGLAEGLDTVPGYAQQPLHLAYTGFDRMLAVLADRRPDNARDAIITGYYGVRKGDLSDGQLFGLEFADVWSFDGAIAAGALSYARGHVMPESENTGSIPYPELPIRATSLSSCIFPNKEASRASVAEAHHQAAIRKAKEWFVASGIVQAKPNINRDAGGLITAATLEVIGFRMLFG